MATTVSQMLGIQECDGCCPVSRRSALGEQNWPLYFLNGSISTGIDRLYVSPRPGAKFHYKLQRYVKLHDLLLTLKTSDHVSVIFELADKPRRKRKA